MIPRAKLFTEENEENFSEMDVKSEVVEEDEDEITILEEKMHDNLNLAQESHFYGTPKDFRNLDENPSHKFEVPNLGNLEPVPKALIRKSLENGANSDYGSAAHWPDFESGSSAANYADIDTGSTFTSVSLTSSGFGDEDPSAISKLFVCPVCKRKFVSLARVQAHIFKFHRIPVHVQEQMKTMGLQILETEV